MTQLALMSDRMHTLKKFVAYELNDDETGVILHQIDALYAVPCVDLTWDRAKELYDRHPKGWTTEVVENTDMVRVTNTIAGVHVRVNVQRKYTGGFVR